ncbi:MAG TPA: aminotransferase class V-fold PLP-dependent enzyme [Gaiellaceae bacterium]|nr:aminotransferase class V-fold PLP-dependent enzyme [Gaiellaceae bacterium]
MDPSAYRDRFPILAETTYLINHSLAAMPAAAEERLVEYARMWKTRGIRSWGEGWWQMPLTVGDQVGRIVGAPPGTVCMHQNVTVAVAVVLSCFRLEPPRNRIVYLEGEFPSVRYLVQAQPRAEVEVVPDLDALLDAIDERTLLVPLSHVLFKTAELQDVAAVQRRAAEVGAHVLLDAYQSAGAVPLDVTALGVSFATGGSVKWLCGGPGAGWLYVRPDLIDRLEPTFVGWQGHARPFAFEPELEYAEGIARFLTGTPNVPALYAATAGYDAIEEVGVDRIRERSLALTDLLIRLADEAGYEVTSRRDRARRGASVTVRVPGFEGVHRELAERQVLCDFRPDVGLRLGPHFFNTEDELEFAIGQIGEILASGAHERHLGAAARF